MTEDIFDFKPAVPYDVVMGVAVIHHIATTQEHMENFFLKLKGLLSDKGMIAFMEPRDSIILRLYLVMSFSMNWYSERGGSLDA